MLARKTVYCRGINADIERVVSSCSKCLARRSAPARKPLVPHEVPNRPWQKVGVDLFTCLGKRYQIVTDYFSKWVEVNTVPRNAVSGDVIRELKNVFGRIGIPESVFSDGDPLYSSHEFNKFSQEYGFNHKYSSAGYPRSNGQVESKVKFIKNLLLKCSTIGFDMALLHYRNTPLGVNIDSPAMLLLGRNLRTNIPTVEKSLIKAQDNNSRLALEQRKLNDKYNFDRKCKPERNVYNSKDLVQYVII